MQFIRKQSSTSNVFRVSLRNSSTGAGFTGLGIGSTGLIVSTICDNEAAATTYTAAGSTIETITTLGTFATPTATKCRLKEVDATNHPGLVELQFADARFAVAGAKILRVTIGGVTNLLQKDVTIQLTSIDVDDAVRGGMTALPNTAVSANASLITSGTGTDQLSVSAGVAKANLAQILGTALTETAGQIAAAFKKFFNIGTPAATMDHLILVDTVTTYTGNTPQTGDGFAVVNHGTYGNAQLVRSTTPANPLDVSATGEAGLDFNNVKDATGAHTLTNIRIPNVTLVDTITTYTGNTPQTGDNYAIVVRLAIGSGGEVTVGGMNANTVTASAFTQAAADKAWSSTTRSLTDKVGFALSAAGIQAVWDALSSALTTAGSIGKRIVDFLTGDIFGRLGAPSGASTAADIAAVKTDTNNQIQMTTGTGTSRQFTATALANAPAGGGGGSTVNEDNDVIEEVNIVE